ncbi:MAG TPA: efflux RND transporter periplasmic adaptor subunit [Smithella sp.]|mgnify:CR=1 FL=1|nr:efflux RND transporter periplasmic adaptor subunit [Smithella sp.]MDM7987627.1 efflux RND transporter periplasmic adaptor subunit [Smithella sp.]HNY49605.1 efflux RND transporter periplasmic adaptor subunit [Smithella sp.]HOG89378.1 efflux RND transporter periplasmic adaptor subunit [Smithella sp.]HOU51715.1 efflux RND transporter periplasmic adaptor subunit [Smithella sp.]
MMVVKKRIGFNIKRSSKGGLLKLLFLILLIVFISVPLVSCKKEKKVEKENLINVRVAAAQEKIVRPYIETTGSLRADEEVMVSSEVDGIVKSIKVEEGSAVSKGSLLVEINQTDYRLDKQRAEAAMKQAEASLANVKSEFQRKESLYKEELITRQQYDDISTRVILAEADLAKAKSMLETSAERLARTRIYSPLNGMVKEKKVSSGDFARTSLPLLHLIKVDPLKLNFTVSEKDIADLKTGQDVDFTVDSFPGKKFSGKVNLIYPNVEERTRTLQAEAIVPNADRVLKPGLFVRATIYTGPPREVIVAPLTALIYDNATVSLFVVEGNLARERKVTTGRKYGEDIEIIEGLNAKEQIVVVGQNNLSEGIKVNVAR